MIVQGEDIRLSDPYRHKFDSAMAEYVWASRFMEGNDGDDYDCREGDVCWANRYGRRILSGNDQGFVYLQTFDNENEACKVMDDYHTLCREYDNGEDD